MDCNCMAHVQRPHDPDQRCETLRRMCADQRDMTRREVWAYSGDYRAFDGYQNYSPENFGGGRNG